MFTSPLPARPPFPTYGLEPQFEGFRWLSTWNAPRALYMISLGHGHPDEGRWTSVSTFLKTPQRLISANATHGPTGFGDARSSTP